MAKKEISNEITAVGFNPLRIGDREIPLRFRMNQFAEAEEEIGSMAEIEDLLMNGKARARNLAKMIRIMGNAGLKHEGQEPDLTDEWLLENMMPKYLQAYQVAVCMAMSEETQMQAPKAMGENEERDLVLEELNKKKDPTNSHTDGSSAGD